MVDFILLVFFLVVFAGGFWCGARFGTLKSMCREALETMRGWVK